MSPRSWARVPTASSGKSCPHRLQSIKIDRVSSSLSSATNIQTGEGVAVKKVTNVFSKKILAKRALREIKLLQHFRGHRNVCPLLNPSMPFRALLTPRPRAPPDHLPLRYGHPPPGELQRDIFIRGYVMD